MQITTIICDGCGLRFAGTKKNAMLVALDKLGWKRGPGGTHFCSEDTCQRKLLKMTETARNAKKHERAAD